MVIRRITTCMAILAAVCGLAHAEVSQDFNSWPDLAFASGTHQGWGFTNGYVYNDGAERVGGLVDSGNSYVMSPLLSDGVGSITIIGRSMLNGNYTFAIESSTNTVDWNYTVVTVTNKTDAWATNTYSANIIRPSYIRITKIAGGGGYWYLLNDIVISEDPEPIVYTNTVLDPTNPVINSAVDVSIDVFPGTGVSSLTMALYYSTNNGASFTSVGMSRSGDTYTGQIPAVSTIGGIVQYYHEATFDYQGQTSAKDYYPPGGSNETMAYVCNPVFTSDRDQDFESWPSAGWSANGVFVYSSEVGSMTALMYPTNLWESTLTTPLLEDGVGTIYFNTRNYAAAQEYIYDVLISPDGSSWTPLRRFTNTLYSKSSFVTNMIEVNDYRDLFVRWDNIDHFGGESVLMDLDNIFISYPPAKVIVTNIAHTKGYMYTTNPVTVVCSVSNYSADIPAGNFQPKLCYRMAGQPIWVTNSMSHEGNGDYSCTIPPQPRGEVQYYVRCDYAGYSHAQWGNDECKSPEFSPPGSPTNYQPYTYHTYNVRGFLSEYEYLSATSDVGETAVMHLIDDYTWQGVMDLTENPQTELTFGFSGFNQFTNGASDYSPYTNHWRETATITSALPLTGTGCPDGSALTATGTFAAPIAFRFNTKTWEYLVLNAYYQDFNLWQNASSEYFQRSIFGAQLLMHTNLLSGYANSTIYPPNFITGTNYATSADFDTWESPSNYNGTATLYGNNDSGGYYYIKNARLIHEQGVNPGTGAQTDKAIALRDFQNLGSIWPARGYLLDGLGRFSFDYRCGTFDRYWAWYDSSPSTWDDVSIMMKVTFNSSSEDSYISIMSHYDNGPPQKFNELRFAQLVGTKYVGRIYPQMHYADGSTTNYITQSSLRNVPFAGYQRFEHINCINKNYTSRFFNIATFMDNASDGITRSDYFQRVFQQNVSPYRQPAGSFAILPVHADFNMECIQVRPCMVGLQGGNWTHGLTGNDVWITNDLAYFSASAAGLYNNGSSYIRSPRLSFNARRIRYYFNYLTTYGTGYPQRWKIQGAADSGVGGSPGTWNDIIHVVTNDQRNYVAHDISGSYKYIRFVSERQPDDYASYIQYVTIYGDPVYTNDFSSQTNNWHPVAAGKWSLGGGSYSRPGYPGPDVSFTVDVATTNNTAGGAVEPPAGDWKTIYSNDVNNLVYQSVDLDLENIPAPWSYQEHGVPTWVRINHTDGNGSLIIDNIHQESWSSMKVAGWGTYPQQTDSKNWLANEVWVSGGQPSFWRSRTSSNEFQFLQSSLMTNGVGTITFDYKCTTPPTLLDVKSCNVPNAPPPHATNNANYNLAASIVVSNTDWQTISVNIDNTNRALVRIYHAATNYNTRSVLYLDNVKISDYKGINDTMWEAYNALITHTIDDKEFEPYGTPESEYKTCYLNNNATTGTASEVLDNDMPYIQTPFMTKGVGQVSFWVRTWEDEAIPAGKLYFRTSTSRTNPASEWVLQGTMSGITNTKWTYIATNFYVKTNYYLRITCDTNAANAKRVCLDNILVTEPLGANINLVNLHTIPEVPTFNDPVYITVELSDRILNPSNITMTAHYFHGTNDSDWVPTGSIGMTTNGGPGNIYTTTSAIPAYPIDDVVQYYIEATFNGEYANSPKYYKMFTHPAWYYPVNLNSNKLYKTPYYYSFSCTTGAVWINEYNIWEAFFETNQYIELCGRMGADIESWKLDIESGGGFVSRYTVVSNTVFQNETNGFGFWLIGQTNVPGCDQPLTNQLLSDYEFRLVRSMGAWVDYVDDSSNSDEFLMGDYSVGRMGTGSVASAFDWYAGMNMTPGGINTNRQEIWAVFNPYVLIEIIDTWNDSAKTYISYDVLGTNYFSPAPWYATNMSTETIEWQIVPSFTTDTGNNCYTQSWNTPTGGEYYYKILATNYFE